MICFSNIGKMGRLGNQLFQIATTISTANRYNTEAKFYKWKYSDFFKNKIDQGLNSDLIRDFFIYRESSFNYKNIENRGNMDLLGYFQSERYFMDNPEKVRYYFDFIDELNDGSIGQDFNSCSIHIRRGDYLNVSDYHPFPGMEYYKKSIYYMRDIGVNKFYVFSDDIEWCKNEFKEFLDLHYIEGNTNIKDLCLMSSCKNNIIANSSFSWWGAWLNKNTDKKIIAPKIWFGPAKKGVITDDLYCEGWIKM
jgi:hypothetical protein